MAISEKELVQIEYTYFKLYVGYEKKSWKKIIIKIQKFSVTMGLGIKFIIKPLVA